MEKGMTLADGKGPDEIRKLLYEFLHIGAEEKALILVGSYVDSIEAILDREERMSGGTAESFLSWISDPQNAPEKEILLRRLTELQQLYQQEDQHDRQRQEPVTTGQNLD